MIHEIRVKNYKALRHLSLQLGRIHALIGPNDSGKTSLLQAAAALCRSVDHNWDTAFLGAWEGRDLVWRTGDVPVLLGASLSDDFGPFEYEVECEFDHTKRSAVTKREEVRNVDTGATQPLTTGAHHSRVQEIWSSSAGTADVLAAKRVHSALSGVQFIRWNPRFLALPVAPQEQQHFWIDPSGFGLPLLLDDILGEDRSAFDGIEARLRQVFPQVKSIKLSREPGFTAPTEYRQELPELRQAQGKGLRFEFSNGDEFRASQVSDGLLLILAYLTVLHLPTPPRMILVEEPENGVHPKRLREVLSLLRDMASEKTQSQVLLTTHSPYVVDLFQPDEVSLCRLGNDGAVTTTRLCESEFVSKQLDVFTLGEIWTAEGEEQLVDGNPSTGS